MRLVLDCSVAIKWFVPETLSEVAEVVLAALERHDVELLAPATIDAEFAHALRKLTLGGRASREDALMSLERFLDADIERAPYPPLATKALELALDHMATFYDALYMALAEREKLKVITADERMVSAFAKLDRTISLADFRLS